MTDLLAEILLKFNKSPAYNRKRQTLSPQIRRQVYERDNYKCVFCKSSQKMNEEQLDVAHLIPVVSGGQDVLENLVTSCYPCHILFDKREHRRIIKDGIARKKKDVAEGKSVWKGRGKDKKPRKRPRKQLAQLAKEKPIL